MGKSSEIRLGKGAQFNPENPFAAQHYTYEHVEGLDEEADYKEQIQLFEDYPKKIVNKVTSPDLGLSYSLNPYQGCEHGCAYCYARNSHTYWGWQAGLDFETKLIVKPEAPKLFAQFLQKHRGPVLPVMISGNTDCYQPIERKFGLTRQLLEVALAYRYPVSLITKNALILKDQDLLQELAKQGLAHVFFSINSCDENIRRKLEPRTATYKKKLSALKTLTEAGVPCGVMVAPIIPGLNLADIPNIVKDVAEAGALKIGYTVVRLNGQVKDVFKDWLERQFPDRAEKVWHQVQELHGGKVNDTDWGRRMKGEGTLSHLIHDLFEKAMSKHLQNREMPAYNLTAFHKGGNYSLF